MGFYNDRILPWLTHFSMRGGPFPDLRKRALAEARGVVLEVGFGSGANLPYYPPGIARLLAVEPSEVSRGIARKAIARAPFPVEFAGMDGQSLNLSDASVDCAVSTFTLCTIPDAARALAEIARVLKPGGMLLFAEHGASEHAGVAKWQHRLNGLQQHIAGGCNLNRNMDALITASPLELVEVDHFYVKGPKTHTYIYLGKARKG